VASLLVVHAIALGLATLVFAWLAASRPVASAGGPVARRWRGGLLVAGGLLVGPAAVSTLALV